jgi:hypothetical protein
VVRGRGVGGEGKGALVGDGGSVGFAGQWLEGDNAGWWDRGRINC